MAISTREQRETGKTRRNPLQQRVRDERRSVYRQAIREAAERVFAAKGADASHMREIAAEAGVSLGTLYDVIGGKDSLLEGIHRLRMRDFLACIGEACDAHDETLASHLAVLREGGQYFLDRPDFLRMCCRDGYGWAERLPETAGGDIWDEGASIPRDLFERGIAEGIYYQDDPHLLVRKMLALKQIELTYWVEQGSQTPHGVVLDRLETQFLRAFCVRAD